MRFALPYGADGSHGGEIRFAFQRRTTNGVERVRLVRALVVYAGEQRDVYQRAADYVLGSVALPRHRTNTESTLSRIIAALNADTERDDWRCVNEHRVCRRRNVGIRRRRRTFGYDFRSDGPSYRHVVHSYSHKPNPRFRVAGGEGGDARTFFGIELEIDQNQGREHQLDPAAVPDVAHPLFYCKQDGSLNNGVELVSHPGTLGWWNEQRQSLTDMLSQLTRMGWRSHEVQTCGMHIHISQTAFDGSMHIYRFLHLVYRYPELSLLVSQRHRSRLNQWSTLSYNKKPSLKRKAEIELKGREWERADNGGHYDGVNSTGQTYELRIFNGTMKPERFFKNLQYAAAALEFTRDTMNLRHISAPRFVAYVAERSEQYPDLHAFFVEHASHAALAEKRVAA